MTLSSNSESSCWRLLCWPIAMIFSLELQSAFARRVCHCLDSAVIQVTAAIENDFVQVLGQGALGNQVADLLGTFNAATRAFAQFSFRGGCCDKRMALHIID